MSIYTSTKGDGILHRDEDLLSSYETAGSDRDGETNRTKNKQQGTIRWSPRTKKKQEWLYACCSTSKKWTVQQTAYTQSNPSSTKNKTANPDTRCPRQSPWKSKPFQTCHRDIPSRQTQQQKTFPGGHGAGHTARFLANKAKPIVYCMRTSQDDLYVSLDKDLRSVKPEQSSLPQVGSPAQGASHSILPANFDPTYSLFVIEQTIINWMPVKNEDIRTHVHETPKYPTQRWPFDVWCAGTTCPDVQLSQAPRRFTIAYINQY